MGRKQGGMGFDVGVLLLHGGPAFGCVVWWTVGGCWLRGGTPMRRSGNNYWSARNT